MIRSYISILSLILLFISLKDLVCCEEDPTFGFNSVPLTEANFKVQKPYDIPLEQRYSYKDGVHRLWVYADDKPHDPNSHTQPRTEIRIQGLDYQSGVWQFEGYAFVPNGTSGASVAQIHGAEHVPATLILRIFNGEMRYYNEDFVADNLYDKWFRLNIIHDVNEGFVTVFINGEKKFHTKDHGPSVMYFKCGAYGGPYNINYYMEARWRDIKIYKK